MSTQSPIELADQLLDLVKSIHQPQKENNDKNTYDQKNRITALCDELKRSIIGPLEHTILLAESCQESSALRFISELGVADIIADETVSLSEISKRTGVDIRYLQITMSCLLAHGYFEEVESFGSGLFRNNAMSNVLRSGHTGTLREAVGFICDEGFKSTAYLLEGATFGMKDRTNSDHETKRMTTTAASLAFGFQGSIFDWMSSAEQAYRGKRMGKAMQQLHHMANQNVVVDFEWNNLVCPIVDIGGGIGSLEMALLKAHPSSALNFMIFDIPETIQNAKKVWNTEMSTSAQAHVSFVSGDFLAANAEKTNIPKGQSTYIIRHVLHDWTDDEVIAILRNIRVAMLCEPNVSAAPRLMLCEMILRKSSPRFVRTTSMQILALNNGMTRTEKDLTRLVNEAGFMVVKVHAMRSVDSIIEAVPNT